MFRIIAALAIAGIFMAVDLAGDCLARLAVRDG